MHGLVLHCVAALACLIETEEEEEEKGGWI